MPTLAEAPAPPAAPPPVLTQADLDDPEKFSVLPGVPILDAHADPERGDVTGDTLGRMLANRREKEARNVFAAVSLGHYHARTNPRGMTVSHPDGTRLRVEADTEPVVPKPVGYASRWRLGKYEGRPCLFADINIHNRHYDEASDYPFWSAERLPRTEDIDRVALLRRPPEREFGPLHYARDEGDDERIYYSRDFHPLKMKAAPDPAAASSAPEPEPGPVPEPSPPPLPDAGEKEPETMPLTPEDLDAIRNLFKEMLHEELTGPDEEVPPTVPEEPVADAVDAAGAAADATRDNHAAEMGEAGAGGMGTTVPELIDDEPTRENYARNLALIDRAFGATDERLSAADKQLQWVAGRLVAVEKQLGDARVENRRLVYRKELLDARGDGYYTLTDAVIADMLKDVAADLPADFEARKLKDIRTNYARSPVGAGQRLQAGTLEVGGNGSGGNGQPSVAELRMAQAYAGDPKNKCGSFSEALAKIRAK